MTKIARSGSGSISQRHESPDPDPYQNVLDPQHALYRAFCSGGGSAECARPAPVVADGRPARRQRPSRGQPGNRQRAGGDNFYTCTVRDESNLFCLLGPH